MHPHPDADPGPTPSHNQFRRGSTWLRKTGVGHTGKKAKRLIHRRDRHTIRKQLQQII